MMKRMTIVLMTMLLGAASSWAVPAHPGTRKVQQPDGTYVTIRLVGDEWCHFQTTADGYSVVQDSRGYYVYAENRDGRLQATARVAHDEDARTVSEREYLSAVRKKQAPAIPEQLQQLRSKVQQRQQQTLASRRSQMYNYNYKKFKGLIILVQFNDKEFSREDYPQILDNMVNKENYTGYDKQQFTGSVRDYFSDNSNGKFQPQFDVVGPVTINYSQYDCQGGYQRGDAGYDSWRSSKITLAAIRAADADVDYSKYDGDGDGKVDLVYFVFAGNGANYNGNDKRLWWPHRSILMDPDRYWEDIKCDGVVLEDYASSVELQGYTLYPTTVKIDGIGTICHEFSHVLGLPDFYDTNYDQDGKKESEHPGIWSLMSRGSYENDGRTPVGYSLFERWAVGFLESDPQLITKEGSYSLEALPISFKGYRLDTPVKDEFFLFENRQRSAFKWDKYLPGNGLLVHRVDLTNKSVWEYNDVNADPDHNYYEVVRAGGSQYGVGSASDVFPGTQNVRQLRNDTSPANLLTWSGKPNSLGLTDIQVHNGVVTFQVTGYEVESVTVTPTVIDELGVGYSQQLVADIFPNIEETTISWTSSDNHVATVDANGLVTGVAVGQCTITASSENGKKGTCQVTVKEIEACTIAEYKTKTVGTTQLLKLEDAKVLAVSTDGKTAFVRSTTGDCLMLTNLNGELKTGDVANGILVTHVYMDKNVIQAIVDGAQELNTVAGSEPEPREVTLDELTEADYSDLLIVKSSKLKRKTGRVWAFGDTNEARLSTTLTGASMGTVTSDHYYDVTAIYGTDLVSGNVVNQLNITKSVQEVTALEAIIVTKTAVGVDNSAAVYNLQGQQVNSGYKGIVVKNGRKIIMK